MESLDVIVLRTLRDWRCNAERALLVTVVRTWGSSPRPVGSIMAINAKGAVVGSVSGGCIEDDLIHSFCSRTDLFESQSYPARLKYGISGDEAHRFGLPCGGTIELVLELNPDAGLVSALVDSLERGQLMQRCVDMTTGLVSQKPTEVPAQLVCDGAIVMNTFGPEYRMLIIGAGQLSEYLATMALFNGFAVTVCDPREEYRGAWSVRDVTLVTEMPDDVVREFHCDLRSCVIALTHDPKLDDLALLEALETSAFYVGAIGSRRNNAKRRSRMTEHFGKTEEGLRRLRGPIGIFIGSKTPAEIAVSVMAEVLAVKNGVALTSSMNVANAKNALFDTNHPADECSVTE